MNPSIKVIENMSDNQECFDSKEDFIKYYNINKTKIDEISTRGLNRIYIIDGYKLGRKEGQLIFIPTIQKQIENEQDSNLEQKFDDLFIEISKLKTKVDSILKLLNSLNYQ